MTSNAKLYSLYQAAMQQMVNANNRWPTQTTSPSAASSMYYFSGAQNSTTWATTSASTSTVTIPLGITGPMHSPMPVFDDNGGAHQLKAGREYVFRLPNGTVISVLKDGSYAVIEDDVPVVYKAAPRDFNKFLSASDRIEEFIKFCGQNGVRRQQMLKLPLELFVVWLIIEAAKADGEPEPDLQLLPLLKQHASLPRCQYCGRFMCRAVRAKGITTCRVTCFKAEMARAA